MSITTRLLSTCIALAVSAAAFALPAKELSNWSILVAPDAIPSEQFAAQEFQSLWQACSGTTLPISNVGETGKNYIVIGPGMAHQCGVNNSDLGEEGLRIRVSPKAIVITGGRPRGTLYGVYEFFERYVGTRFLTTDHTWFPEDAASREFKTGDYSYVPPFAFRWSYYGENNTNPAFATRMRVNTVATEEKFGGVTPQNLISHSLYHQCPAEKYGKEHPEYFALVGGERKLEMHGGGPELCLTNPAVLDIVTESVLADLEKNPQLRNISVSQNDNDAYCRCENCEAINQREGTPMGTYLTFVNAVAERIEPKFPNTKIGTLAYWHTRKAPKTIRPRHNVQIQLCSIECCTLHAINDPACAKNKEFCDDLANWKAISEDIWVWNYNTNFASYDLPFPNLRSIEPNVKYFLDNNVHGLFMQASGNCLGGEMSDLRNYVISHTIWNPKEGGWARVEEFCALHYGPAAGPILEYLKAFHDRAESSGLHPDCFPTAMEVGLDRDFALESVAWFQKALELAPDQVIKDRVEKASLCAWKALVETSGGTRYENGMCYIDLPKSHENLIETYVALGRKAGLTMARETQTAEEFYASLHSMTGGFPATRIENDVWQITVLPEHNGKLASMIYKPTGRDVVFPRGRMFARHRAMEEWGVAGFTDKDLLKFSAEVIDNGVTLTGKLDDRLTVVRRIDFDPADPTRVRFHTTLTHHGAEPTNYQVWIHPEYDTNTTAANEKAVTGYVEYDGWKALVEDDKFGGGPNEETLRKATGNKFAFYNSEAGFGVVQTYNRDEIERLDLFWRPNRSQINLELYTRTKELKSGESFDYGYTVQYLDKSPE